MAQKKRKHKIYTSLRTLPIFNYFKIIESYEKGKRDFRWLLNLDDKITDEKYLPKNKYPSGLDAIWDDIQKETPSNIVNTDKLIALEGLALTKFDLAVCKSKGFDKSVKRSEIQRYKTLLQDFDVKQKRYEKQYGQEKTQHVDFEKIEKNCILIAEVVEGVGQIDIMSLPAMKYFNYLNRVDEKIKKSSTKAKKFNQ